MLTGTVILFKLKITSVFSIPYQGRSYNYASAINLLPLCTKGILSKKSITLLPWDRLGENFPLIHKDEDCRLQLYNKIDFGNCVEALNSIATYFDANREDPNAGDDAIKATFSFMNRDKSNSLEKIDDKKASGVKFRMSFMGDSRIHQMYLNFVLQVLRTCRIYQTNMQ